MKDAEGKPTGVIAVARDITERKQIEEALRESEEKYRDLVENINDIIYAVDEHGVMTYVSPVIESFIGYSPPEVIGRSFIEFIYPEDLQRIRKSFQRLLSGHGEANEYRVLTKSGEIRWMRTSSQPVFIGDRVIGVQGVLADITERKRAEEEREQLVLELQDTLAKVKILSGLLPICASCKKIRDDEGYWNQLETYIQEHSQAEFSHGICPECAKKLYPEYFAGDEQRR